jgi:hypothetical protein
MPATKDLVDLERRSWEALATEGAAAPYYEEVLDEDPVVLMPGGMVIDDRQTIIDSMGGPAWKSYDLEEMDVHVLTRNVGVVTYGAHASRDGSEDYSALMTSVYVKRPDGWKLALHQQTPR